MAIQAEKLANLLCNDGFHVIKVKTNPGIPERIGFLSNFPGLRTLINVLLFLNYLHKSLPHSDVVYLLTGFFSFFFWVTCPALILIRLHGKRVVLSARGGAAEDFFRKYGRLIKPILRRVDVITTPSGFLKDVFRRALGTGSVVIPNVVDLTQFPFHVKHCFRPRLVVTRSLEEIYNIADVIKAFKIVHNHFPKARLGIVGDGTQRVKLQALATKVRLANNVIFYGEVQHQLVQELYAKYDIFVNASEIDNLPGAVLEAFASGLPVVSTNSGGIPYIVENGVTGLLVDVGDFRSLARKVIQLVNDPGFAAVLAKNARDKCREYSWEHVRSLLLPLFEG